MKHPTETYITELSPTEAQRAQILRAALLQLLAETEIQMLRIEQAFKVFDAQFQITPQARGDSLANESMT